MLKAFSSNLRLYYFGLPMFREPNGINQKSKHANRNPVLNNKQLNFLNMASVSSAIFLMYIYLKPQVIPTVKSVRNGRFLSSSL